MSGSSKSYLSRKCMDSLFSSRILAQKRMNSFQDLPMLLYKEFNLTIKRFRVRTTYEALLLKSSI